LGNIPLEILTYCYHSRCCKYGSGSNNWNHEETWAFRVAALKCQRLRKVAERIRLTNQKLKAGIDVDVVKEADEVQILEDAARQDSHISFTGLKITNKGDRK
jgi:hypothetical protein